MAFHCYLFVLKDWEQVRRSNLYPNWVLPDNRALPQYHVESKSNLDGQESARRQSVRFKPTKEAIISSLRGSPFFTLFFERLTFFTLRIVIAVTVKTIQSCV